MNKVKLLIWPIASSIFFVIVGLLLLIFDCLGNLFDNNNILILIIMYLYAMVKSLEYMFGKKEGDYEDLLMCMASVITGTAGIVFWEENVSQVLSLTLIGWVAIVSVVKLIKIDFLKEKNENESGIRIVLLSAFILTGILASVNLYYDISAQNVILGYFFLINGLLEFACPIYKLLIIRRKEAKVALKKNDEVVSSLKEDENIIGKIETASSTKKSIKKSVEKSSNKNKKVGTTLKKESVKKPKSKALKSKQKEIKKSLVKEKIKKESAKVKSSAKAKPIVNKKSTNVKRAVASPKKVVARRSGK